MTDTTRPITQWSINEMTFHTDNAHDWAAFPIQVEFSHAEAKHTLDAYWDGDLTWRVRYTPTRPGPWTWTVRSAEAGLDGRSGSFHAQPASEAEVRANPNLRGHIGPSENGHHYVYADGTPFLLLGDTCWEMNQGRNGLGGNRDGRFFTWLRDRKAKGFTTVNHWFYASGHPKPGVEHPSVNEGGPAFELTDDRRYVFDRPNPRYYEYVDQRWDTLWREGFVMAGPPTWFRKPDRYMSLEGAKNVSRYLLARYGAYNLLWALSGEYSYRPNVDRGVWSSRETWVELGEFVAAHNAYGHPVSVHPGPAAVHVSSSQEFNDTQWLGCNWLQTGQYFEGLYRVGTWSFDDYNRSPTRPVHQSEGHYEGGSTDGMRKGAARYHVRFQPWTALLNGSCGAVYGAHGVWEVTVPSDPDSYSWSPGGNEWKVALRLPGSQDIRHVADFFGGLPWWKLVPHFDWLTVDGTESPRPTEDDITPPHCASDESDVTVVYVPEGNEHSDILLKAVDVNTRPAKWYDPRTGEYLACGALTSDGNGSVRIPERPAPADADWVLLVRS